jgi:hypothetical protein
VVSAAVDTGGSAPQPIALTFDVDWAPDFMIDAIAHKLIECAAKSTWFVTHASPAIDRLRERPDLFELGIHPNFLDGSSHGDTIAEVLATCMSIVPEARTMRSHALVQSSPMLAHVIEATQIRCDSSIMLFGASHLAPVGFPHAEGPLVRVPYFWEDDVEMMRDPPGWTLETDVRTPGLRIYDFHPVHVFLNASDMGPYHELRRAGPLTATPEALANGLVRTGPGAGTLFCEIAEHLADVGSRTLHDIASAYRRGAAA